MQPIYKLMSDVAQALHEYDQSRDHTPHEAGANCVRCNLEQSIRPQAILLQTKRRQNHLQAKTG